MFRCHLRIKLVADTIGPPRTLAMWADTDKTQLSEQPCKNRSIHECFQTAAVQIQDAKAWFVRGGPIVYIRRFTTDVQTSPGTGHKSGFPTFFASIILHSSAMMASCRLFAHDSPFRCSCLSCSLQPLAFFARSVPHENFAVSRRHPTTSCRDGPADCRRLSWPAHHHHRRAD